jgi:hypothetical protein
VVTPVDGDFRVRLVDMRFGTPRQQGLFSFAALVSADGKVTRLSNPR